MEGVYERVDSVYENGEIKRVRVLRGPSPIVLGLKNPDRVKAEQASGAPGKTEPVFITSTRFLMECYRYLMQRETEVLHDVSGISHNGIYTLENLEALEIKESSFTRAKSDLISTNRTLVRLEKFGLLLTGIFHSHPGRGSSSVTPSATDIRNQRKYEKVGYTCVGGIFSRDGWVRFFSAGLKFEVVVKGKGVHRAGDNLYRITFH